MRALSHAIGLAALLAGLAGAAHAADPAEGEWVTPGGAARVRIGPCAIHAERLCGVIVWLETARIDSHNPDPKLRARSIVGIPFLSGFHREGPGHWTGGSIYDPEGGKTYDSKMQVQAGGVLKLDGCVLMFCRTQTWRRPG
jgi:uncharacterized protein (DUF2147 family)